ncbi:MAG: hypothetical protein BMS9Abin07_1159 [Acidimicrobiia bacterium]|nr:MAG: hypothetical protein BMS9Abin07_1159 [Acidimicrobiia bacterium]
MARILRAWSIFAVLAAVLLGIPAEVAAAEIDLEDQVYGGLYSSEFFAAEDLEALGIASSALGRVTFGGTFHHVGENDYVGGGTWSNTRELLDEVWRAAATPFANVVVDGASAAAIASGEYDDAIEAWASHVEQYLDIDDGLPQRRVIIAPLQEANGTWVSHGCDPASFKTAYRKFVDIFRDRGIDETRVRWAFAPNGWTPPGCGEIADYYPGDSYVDVLAFSAYNFGSCFPGSSWTPVSWSVDGPISELTAINPVKPIVVAQIAAPRSCERVEMGGLGEDRGTGGDQASWVKELFDYLRAKENVAGFIWFNVKKVEPGNDSEVLMDWRIWDTASWVSPGWKDGLPGVLYRWPLSDWFRPGPLTIGLERGTPPCSKVVCDSVGYFDSEGQWWLWDGVSAEASQDAFSFGDPGDIAFMGDWDGDGVATPGLYRRSDGFVYLRNSNTPGVADITFFLGNSGDLPLVGDFDGDGKDTVSIYRPSQGKVYVINELGLRGGGLGAAQPPFIFGNPGDTPFVGDFDGDGIDTVGMYRASTGFAYFRDSLTDGAADYSVLLGEPGDTILAGDWDGDGDDTVAVYRPSTRRVYMYLENTATAADYSRYVGTLPIATTWGRVAAERAAWASRWPEQHSKLAIWAN